MLFNSSKILWIYFLRSLDNITVAVFFSAEQLKRPKYGDLHTRAMSTKNSRYFHNLSERLIDAKRDRNAGVTAGD